MSQTPGTWVPKQFWLMLTVTPRWENGKLADTLFCHTASGWSRKLGSGQGSGQPAGTQAAGLEPTLQYSCPVGPGMREVGVGWTLKVAQPERCR